MIDGRAKRRGPGGVSECPPRASLPVRAGDILIVCRVAGQAEALRGVLAEG
jgi:hypothetical protein